MQIRLISTIKNDLNPIENLWSILQDSVIEKRAYTYEKPRGTVVDVWWSLNQQVIRNLFDGMGKRVEHCIKVDGGRFKR